MRKSKWKSLIYIILSFVFLFLLFDLYKISTSNNQTELIYDENGYIEFQKNIDIADIASFSMVDEITIRENYNNFIEELKKKQVTEVYAEFTGTKFSNNLYFFKENDKACYVVESPMNEGFKKELLEYGVKIYSKAHIFERLGLPAELTHARSISLVGNIISISVSLLMLFYFAKMGNSTSTKKKASVDVENMKNSKTFQEIGGLKELKKDLLGLVDFIKNGEKYQESGAKLPSGVLLVGPPGTGKTVLAKAVAKEANVPFLYMSGSEFVQMFVGMGAARVRELFKTARKQAPCIIFIDEIDALCASRKSSDGHSEDRKTLTALLAEMDGFEDSTGILVIGATNQYEVLDPAVTRPGRFTEIYHVPNPETVEERMEIIEIYKKNKKFSEDVDFHAFAKTMIGRSPAEIEAVLNEAAIISVQKGLSYITNECMDEAFYKRIMKGHQKDNKETDKKDLKIVAYHESGHVLMAKLNHHEVSKVTILPSTSGAGGVTFIQPNERKLYTKKMLEDEVCELYGGVVAEYLLNGCNWDLVTTGCSNDIEKATILMKSMVNLYGMSDKGLVNMEVLNKNAKETTENVLFLASELRERTIQTLNSNKERLELLANALLEKETLHEDEIDKILEL